jgi:hypothetical protein
LQLSRIYASEGFAAVKEEGVYSSQVDMPALTALVKKSRKYRFFAANNDDKIFFPICNTLEYLPNIK